MFWKNKRVLPRKNCCLRNVEELKKGAEREKEDTSFFDTFISKKDVSENFNYDHTKRILILIILLNLNQYVVIERDINALL